MSEKKKLTKEQIIANEIDEILKHKYIESEKAGRDLGEDAVKEWVKKYAEEFREYWEMKLKEEGEEEEED